MTFAAYENSRDQGEPISLLYFRYGTDDSDFFAYTDAEQDFVFQGVTYEAVTIQMGEITSSGTLDKATITVEMSEDTSIVDLFRLRPPSAVVTLIVRQGHVNDPDADFIVGWSGRVTGFEIDPKTNQAALGCEPIATSMQRTMLRRHWQYGCPLVLYGPDCKASRAANSTNQVVLAVSGSQVTLAADWAPDARKVKYRGGQAEWIDDAGRRQLRRVIDSGLDGTVTLALAADGLAPGDTITMVLGCNHKTGIPLLADDGDCLPLFNNIRNFGGDPWIPLQNPVGIKNNYY